MFGMSLTEILVVLVLLLVVVGPERLPEMARTAGKWMREIRRATNLFRNTMMLEAEEGDSTIGGDDPIDLGRADVEESTPRGEDRETGEDQSRSTRMRVVSLEAVARTVESELRTVPLGLPSSTHGCRSRRLSPPHRTLH